MFSRRRWLLATPALAGLKVLAVDVHAKRSIKAGPFSMECPAAWTEGLVVEKVAAKPLYSAEAWKTYQDNKLFSLKPSYGNRPQHWAIRIPRLAVHHSPSLAEYGEFETAPQILIHQTSGWAGILESGVSMEAERNAETIQLRARFDAMVQGKVGQRMPPFVDGGFNFAAARRVLHFKGGEGVRMLGQWDIETSLLSAEGLHYLFTGMSEDNSCHVVATFPLKLEGVPSAGSGNASHLGYNNKDYERLVKEYDHYQALAVKWLEARQQLIEPSLKALDAMMESLSVTHWQ